MDQSKTILLGGVFAVMVVLSGCLGVVTGSEPLVLTAEDVGVSDAALAETNFEHVESRTAWINRTVERAGQEREIRVRNHVSAYQRSVEFDPELGVTFGSFVVASTPKAEIAGQALNPVGQMSHAEMMEQFAGQSNAISDVERVDSRTLTVLGEDAEVVRFSGVVEQSGQEVPVFVEVARVDDGDDFVVAIGAYPQATAAEVRPGVTTLFSGIEH